MGSSKQNIWIQMEQIFLRGGGMFDNGDGKWCMLGSAFVSNQAFVCQTVHVCVEPGIFVSNWAFLSEERYNLYQIMITISNVDNSFRFSIFVQWHILSWPHNFRNNTPLHRDWL